MNACVAAGMLGVLLINGTRYSSAEEYLFVPSLQNEYVWSFPGWTSVVKLDLHGRINPVEFAAKQKKPGAVGTGEGFHFYPPVYQPRGVRDPVYEFRIGRLIAGRHDLGNGFIPEVGSKVTTLETYMRSSEFTARASMLSGLFTDLFDASSELPPLKRSDRVIYNLPGWFVPKAKYIAGYGASLPDLPYPKLPGKERTPAIQDDTKYVFAMNEKNLYTMRMGENYYYGHVTIPSGSFAPKDLLNPIRPHEVADFKLPDLMKPQRPNEPVYEIRNGALIPGFLMDEKGDVLFVPEEGAKVIDAESYLKSYSPTSRRIYNLPGKFVEKKQEKK